MPGVYLGSNNKIPAFGISKTEVSNQQFKTFINSGGYQNPMYWDFPTKINGKRRLTFVCVIDGVIFAAY